MVPYILHRNDSSGNISLQIVLNGTKGDLKNDYDVPITKENGERLAKKIKAVGNVETSAKTAEGVHGAIQIGIEAVLKDSRSESLCIFCLSRTTKPNEYN